MSDTPPVYAWIVLVVLTCLSGLFSGLNLGLMSLTVEDLNILINSGEPKQVANAKKIMPLRKRGNLLLCTLLIGNTVVNVCLSVVTDPIWVFIFGTGTAGAILAIALPSALIVVFGEIIPQSVCSRYALDIGAATLPITYFFVLMMLPFSWPISKLLDKLLGDEISGVYTRQGLFHLIKLNVEDPEHAKQSGLTTEDAKILGGALTFKDHTVGQVMTPLNRVFSLPIDTTLDEKAFLKILEKGHTRVPVYEGDAANIVDVLLVKNLLGIGFEHNLSLREVLAKFKGAKRSGPERSRTCVRVPKLAKLNQAMELCKEQHVHMLIVTDVPIDAAGAFIGGNDELASTRDALPPAVGIATIEDFIEEILQEEIVDETDVYVDNEGSRRGSRPTLSSTRQSNARTVSSAGDGGRMRLNSKHYDTTVVLRDEITRRSQQDYSSAAWGSERDETSGRNETAAPPAKPIAEKPLQRAVPSSSAKPGAREEDPRMLRSDSQLQSSSI